MAEGGRVTALTAIYSLWLNHGTKVLGFISGTLSAIAGVGGIIPDAHLKYYMAVIAVTTFWRGFTNTRTTV
jgi:hypothetical protein